jgi:alpha-soluble NSF attachment protein
MSLTGEEYFKKAEGKINRMLFNDYEGSFDNFQKAAGVFKAERNWLRAGEAFMRAGDLGMKLKQPGDAAQMYTESAGCFKKCDIQKATVVMQQAVQLNLENNRLSSAARLLKEWGEALEAEGRLEEALPQFQKAMQYFEAEDQTQSGISCLQKIAKINADLKRYIEAAKIYETIGIKYSEGPLKHQAKEQFFRAFLCRAALVTPDNSTETIASCRENLESYCALDIHFPRTREQEVCERIIEVLEDQDEDKYEDIVGMMHELRMLDDLKTAIMQTIKGNMSTTN